MTYPPQQPPGWPGQPPPDDPQQPASYEIQPYPQYGAGQSYDLPGHPPANQQYSGQPYSGQPYSGQPYAEQQYSGQPYEQQPSAPPYSGQPYSAPPGYPNAPGGPPGFPGGGFPPQSPKRSPLPWVLGGVGVVVVLAVVITLVALVAGGGDPAPAPTAAPTGSPSASESPSPSPSNTPDANGVYGNKILDADTNLYFTKISGSDWQLGMPGGKPTKEFRNPVGQYASVGSKGYAVAQIGELTDEFSYTGPDDLETVKSSLTTSILGTYYGSGVTAKPDTKVKDEALSQYGHKAWLWAYHVSYTDGGEKAGESVVIAVLDAGDGKAGAFWGSVPDGNDSLIDDMTKAAGTLNFRA